MGALASIWRQAWQYGDFDRSIADEGGFPRGSFRQRDSMWALLHKIFICLISFIVEERVIFTEGPLAQDFSLFEK
eukprot:1047464-Amphidinium_carterae.2